jgi:hypothetical protein
VKETVECGGRPLALKVTVPMFWPVDRLAANVNDPVCPGLMVTLVGELGAIATGKIVVGSEAKLLLKLASPTPRTLATSLTEPGASVATVTVSVIGG